MEFSNSKESRINAKDSAEILKKTKCALHSASINLQFFWEGMLYEKVSLQFLGEYDKIEEN